MIRKIVDAKNPCLRKVSKPVEKIDKKILSLIADLKETLLAQKDPEGVGLAAAQIGKNLQVFVMRMEKGLKTVINPQIISISKEKRVKSKEEILEGCLSLPNYYGAPTRAASIKIKYLNEKGEEVIETFKDFPAQIVQHEIDHLKGGLFIDKLLKEKSPLYQVKGDSWEEVDFAKI